MLYRKAKKRLKNDLNVFVLLRRIKKFNVMKKIVLETHQRQILKLARINVIDEEEKAQNALP